MKKVVFILSILLTMAVSCKEGKKEAGLETEEKTEVLTRGSLSEASFSSDQEKAVFTHYQQVRTALEASDAANAQKAAGRLADALGEDHTEVSSIASAMASTDVLGEQRTLFSDLTASLDPVFRESIEGGEIYQQYCPMAFEGKGGFWFSDKEEIRNPYYGDKMLTCGKVTEVITR